MKRENGAAFDHTDIIFIIGSSGLLPWFSSSHKVVIKTIKLNIICKNKKK